jgi:hypothetical protein
MRFGTAMGAEASVDDASRPAEAGVVSPGRAPRGEDMVDDNFLGELFFCVEFQFHDAEGEGEKRGGGMEQKWKE